MKIGDIVLHNRTKEYGTVEYSSFGFSIHTWKHSGGLSKSLGMSEQQILEYWDIVEMPTGYKRHQYGGLVEIE